MYFLQTILPAIKAAITKLVTYRFLRHFCYYHEIQISLYLLFRVILRFCPFEEEFSFSFEINDLLNFAQA